MELSWSASTDEALILGEVDGHHFELTGKGSSREFSFGSWSIGCGWHVRESDDAATLDGMGQIDPVEELVVLRGSVPTGSFDVEVVQGDERSAVILLGDGETERPGWIGFTRSEGPPSLLEWKEPGGAIRQLPLVTRVPGIARRVERDQPESNLSRLWRKLTHRPRN